MPCILHLSEALALLLPLGSRHRTATSRKNDEERGKSAGMEHFLPDRLRLFIDSMTYRLALLQDDGTLSAHQKQYLHALDTQVSDLRDLMSRLLPGGNSQVGAHPYLQVDSERVVLSEMSELDKGWPDAEVVDEADFQFVKSILLPTRLRDHLVELRRRTLLAATQICGPATFTLEEQFEVKHDLVGLAGALGFMELACAMRDALYDPAISSSYLLRIIFRGLGELQARVECLEQEM
jgi:hypothetical protein